MYRQLTTPDETLDVRKHNQILQKINIIKKHTQTLQKINTLSGK